MGGTVDVRGLAPLVKELRGPLYRDVNKELRQYARLIAADMVPYVADAVARSAAPQAAALARTVRPHSDRVPVVVVGKVNPPLSAFRRKGQTAHESKKRRGALAHGVVYGPAGGRRDTPAHENYYRIPRDATGGALGRAMNHGAILDAAADAYLKVYASVMRHHGFIGHSVRSMYWKG